jgi:hypothetical protein
MRVDIVEVQVPAQAGPRAPCKGAKADALAGDPNLHIEEARGAQVTVQRHLQGNTPVLGRMVWRGGGRERGKEKVSPWRFICAQPRFYCVCGSRCAKYSARCRVLPRAGNILARMLAYHACWSIGFARSHHKLGVFFLPRCFSQRLHALGMTNFVFFPYKGCGN